LIYLRTLHEYNLALKTSIIFVFLSNGAENMFNWFGFGELRIC